jgi:hypothetical protein
MYLALSELLPDWYSVPAPFQPFVIIGARVIFISVSQFMILSSLTSSKVFASHPKENVKPLPWPKLSINYTTTVVIFPHHSIPAEYFFSDTKTHLSQQWGFVIDVSWTTWLAAFFHFRSPLIFTSFLVFLTYYPSPSLLLFS